MNSIAIACRANPATQGLTLVATVQLAAASRGRLGDGWRRVAAALAGVELGHEKAVRELGGFDSLEALGNRDAHALERLQHRPLRRGVQHLELHWRGLWAAVEEDGHNLGACEDQTNLGARQQIGKEERQAGGG